jgi:hypothetical protein
MVSVILACSEEVKAKALSAGFREETVLVKHNACLSTEENKAIAVGPQGKSKQEIPLRTLSWYSTGNQKQLQSGQK